MANEKEKTTITFRFGVLNIVAAILSWHVNHSIIWAIIHCLFGWVYVVYYIITNYLV